MSAGYCLNPALAGQWRSAAAKFVAGALSLRTLNMFLLVTTHRIPSLPMQAALYLSLLPMMNPTIHMILSLVLLRNMPQLQRIILNMPPPLKVTTTLLCSDMDLRLKTIVTM